MEDYLNIQNTECQFYPCHKVGHGSEFSCMFCYCPLYPMDECGGNYTKILSGGKLVKDCSQCAIPHTNPALILDKLRGTKDQITTRATLVPEPCSEEALGPIVASAVAYTLEDSTVYMVTGKRHSDCMAQFAKKDLKRAVRVSEEQGFLTQDGHFVNRRVALRVAVRHGQLLPGADGTELFSEMIFG